mgnify:CR=1 FL=1
MYDSLAEAYEKNGHLDWAVPLYEKAQALGKQNNDPNAAVFATNYTRANDKLKQAAAAKPADSGKGRRRQEEPVKAVGSRRWAVGSEVEGSPEGCKTVAGGRSASGNHGIYICTPRSVFAERGCSRASDCMLRASLITADRASG